VSQHYLGSYQRSILAVLLSQFSRKAFRGGMSGVHRLAQTSEPVQVCGQIPVCDVAAGAHVHVAA
jgi:hypothetical protein